MIAVRDILVPSTSRSDFIKIGPPPRGAPDPLPLQYNGFRLPQVNHVRQP